LESADKSYDNSYRPGKLLLKHFVEILIIRKISLNKSAKTARLQGNRNSTHPFYVSRGFHAKAPSHQDRTEFLLLNHFAIFVGIASLREIP